MNINFVKNPVSQSFSDQEAAIIGQELKRIQEEQTTITPVSVVFKAYSPDSPLHKYFEWNDTAAADKYRLWQARQLIANVFIIDTDSPKSGPIRAFVSVTPESDADIETGKGYVFTPGLVNKQNYQDQVLQYAKMQLAMWRKKFGGYKEFFDVVKEIDKIGT